MTNKKARGKRAKTRHKFTRKGSKPTINTILGEFHEGEKVLIKIDSSVHSGMPGSRYHGFTGIVTGMQGKIVKVGLRKGGMEKELLVNPVHLKPAEKEAV